MQDLNTLQCIQWEAIIIDECQRTRTLEHLGNIKILAAEMRLLVVSGQIKVYYLCLLLIFFQHVDILPNGFSGRSS